MQKAARQSTFSNRNRRGFALVFLAFAFTMVLTAPANAQHGRGELQIEVRDPQGQSAAAVAELVSESNHVRKEFAIAMDGKYLAPELAFGMYRLTVTAQGCGIADFDFHAHRSHPQNDRDPHRHFTAKLDQCAPWSESLVR